LQPERCDLYAGAAGAEAPKFDRDRCAEEAQTILRIMSSQSSVEGFPAVLMRRRSGSHRLQSRSRSTRKEQTMSKKPTLMVINARQAGTKPAADRVYVGRPSKWGNPFVIGRDGSRDEVIAKYRAWIVRQPALMAALPELRNKSLVCWCAPERCHAEVLIELANR
jgi:hypothetical protein